MTHKQKIAEYRAALTSEETYSNRMMEEARSEGDRVWMNLWWAKRDGIRKAQILAKILD